MRRQGGENNVFRSLHVIFGTQIRRDRVPLFNSYDRFYDTALNLEYLGVF